MEKFTEFEAATTENVDIRLAVAKNLGLEVKDKLLTLKVSVPRIEFLAIVWIHTVGVIVHGSWKGSHIVLVLCTVKEVGKVAFFQLCEAEGLGEIRQMHGNKTERIDKFDVQLWYGEGKDLCATSNHFGSNAILVEILEDKVPIVSLEIMGDEGRASVLFLEDPLTELVFGTAQKTCTSRRFRFGPRRGSGCVGLHLGCTRNRRTSDFVLVRWCRRHRYPRQHHRRGTRYLCFLGRVVVSLLRSVACSTGGFLV